VVLLQCAIVVCHDDFLQNPAIARTIKCGMFFYRGRGSRKQEINDRFGDFVCRPGVVVVDAENMGGNAEQAGLRESGTARRQQKDWLDDEALEAVEEQR
jgi:hypothetical protein